MYGVRAMKRTNIYLDERQLTLLRRVGGDRATSVAALVREAIDRWLADEGVSDVEEDEWERRLGDLLERRRRLANEHGFDEAQVAADVREAVDEVRRARARGR